MPHFDDDVFISQVFKTDPEMKGEEVLIGNQPVIATIQPTITVYSKLDQTAAVEAKINTENSLFQCTLCERKFKTSRGLGGHMS